MKYNKKDVKCTLGDVDLLSGYAEDDFLNFSFEGKKRKWYEVTSVGEYDFNVKFWNKDCVAGTTYEIKRLDDFLSLADSVESPFTFK